MYWGRRLLARKLARAIDMAFPSIGKLKKREIELHDRFILKSHIVRLSRSFENDLSRSYLFLCHAEIENFLESLAKESALAIFKRYERGKVSPALFSLVATQLRQNAEVDVDALGINAKIERGNWGKKHPLWAKEACGFLHNIVSNNKGVRQENITKMFCPLGLDVTKLDQSFLANLDDLGSKRGEIAHNGPGLKASLPGTSYKALIDQVLEGLPSLTAEVKKLL